MRVVIAYALLLVGCCCSSVHALLPWEVTGRIMYQPKAGSFAQECIERYHTAMTAQNNTLSRILGQGCAQVSSDMRVTWAALDVKKISANQLLFKYIIYLNDESGPAPGPLDLLESCANSIANILPAITSNGIPDLGRGCPSVVPTDNHFSWGTDTGPDSEQAQSDILIIQDAPHPDLKLSAPPPIPDKPALKAFAVTSEGPSFKMIGTVTYRSEKDVPHACLDVYRNVIGSNNRTITTQLTQACHTHLDTVIFADLEAEKRSSKQVELIYTIVLDHESVDESQPIQDCADVLLRELPSITNIVIPTIAGRCPPLLPTRNSFHTEFTDVDSCQSNPCEHGKCIDRINSYECICDPGWEGHSCNTNIDDCTPNPCGHGTCRDAVGGFICSCQAGWSGPTCNVHDAIPHSDNEIKGTLRYTSGSRIRQRCANIYNRYMVALNGTVTSELNGLCGSGIGVTWRALDVKKISSTEVLFYYTFDLRSRLTQLDDCFDTLIDALPRTTRVTIPELNTRCPAIFPGEAYFARKDLQLRSGDVVPVGTCTDCNCKTGTFMSSTACVKCPRGTYQDEAKQTTCKKCSGGTYTFTEGSTNVNDCIQLCEPGTYSDNGMPICLPCPIHNYAPLHGSTECLKCPTRTYTATTGSSKCALPCNSGYYSESGLEPCKPCPPNFYQNIAGSGVCKECPHLTTTSGRTASFSIAQCFMDGNFNDLWANPDPTSEVPPLKGDNGFGVVMQHYTTSSLDFCRLRCQERDFPICVGVDFKPGYGCDLLSMRLLYTDDHLYKSNEPVLRNFDGGYFCSKGEVNLQCSNSNEVLSLHQVRFVNISEYSWANVCEAKRYRGDACHVGEIVDAIRANCVGERSCTFENPCQDTTMYAEIAMDCVADPCHDHVCQNGGSCYPGNHEGYCECTEGFGGNECQYETDICIRNPCGDSGFCIILNEDEYVCECKPGHDGEHCENHVDYCAEHDCAFGSCISKDDGYICECQDGFIGEFCDQNVDMCANNPCKHGGSCEGRPLARYVCYCTKGWEGDTCETAARGNAAGKTRDRLQDAGRSLSPKNVIFTEEKGTRDAEQNSGRNSNRNADRDNKNEEEEEEEVEEEEEEEREPEDRRCPPGHFSHTGQKPCRRCPLETFLPVPGGIQCLACPRGMFADRPGSAKCYPPCSVGFFSDNGLAPCQPCPQHYFQNRPGQTFCRECPPLTTAALEGAFSVAQCYVNRRFSPVWVNTEQPIPVPPAEFDQGFGVVIAHYNTTSRDFCVLKCQERNFPVCIGVDFREGYGCDLLSMRLRYTTNYPFVSIAQPMFRSFVGGYYCSDKEINLKCDKPNEIMALNSLRLIDAYKYSWVNISCSDSLYNGPVCNVQEMASQVMGECNGKHECTLVNPCVDTSKFTELGMDCLANPCFQSPCQKGGICHIGRHGAECECPPGTQGEFCEFRRQSRQQFAPINPCVQNPCFNGGQCVYLAGSDYVCQCPDNWFGSRCESDGCDNRCEHGHCRVETLRGLVGYTCECESGWNGEYCHLRASDDPCLNQPCQHSGLCNAAPRGEYNCSCLFPWTGKSCEIHRYAARAPVSPYLHSRYNLPLGFFFGQPTPAQSTDAQQPIDLRSQAINLQQNRLAQGLQRQGSKHQASASRRGPQQAAFINQQNQPPIRQILSQGPQQQGLPSQPQDARQELLVSQQGPLQQRPLQQGPLQQGPLQQGSLQQGPLQQGPLQQGPLQQGPLQQGPLQQGPLQRGPPQQVPLQQGRQLQQELFYQQQGEGRSRQVSQQGPQQQSFPSQPPSTVVSQQGRPQQRPVQQGQQPQRELFYQQQAEGQSGQVTQQESQQQTFPSQPLEGRVSLQGPPQQVLQQQGRQSQGISNQPQRAEQNGRVSPQERQQQGRQLSRELFYQLQGEDQSRQVSQRGPQQQGLTSKQQIVGQAREIPFPGLPAQSQTSGFPTSLQNPPRLANQPQGLPQLGAQQRFAQRLRELQQQSPYPQPVFVQKGRNGRQDAVRGPSLSLAQLPDDDLPHTDIARVPTVILQTDSQQQTKAAAGRTDVHELRSNVSQIASYPSPIPAFVFDNHPNNYDEKDEEYDESRVEYNGPLGMWSTWSEWSDCSPCGGCGKKTRARVCSTNNCLGEAMEETICQSAPCYQSIYGDCDLYKGAWRSRFCRPSCCKNYFYHPTLRQCMRRMV